jgi:Holliday junction resolvase RusA-like endonuclease
VVNTGEIIASFFIPVEPTGMARPRFSRFGGSYKDKTQRNREKELDGYLRLYAPKSPVNGPVSVETLCCMSIPMSVSKRRRESMLGLFVLPTKKPDLDNMAKQLFDALTRCEFWGDDAVACELIARKIFSAQSGWKVTIRECKFHA